MLRRSPLRPVIAVILAVLVLLCAIVLPPLINANRLRNRLAGSLRAALGRDVQLDNVTLRLLPRPGFAFENLEVAEDPAFGAEPVLRAANVTVGVRLLPLWRGRVEVATIALDQASVNLARNSQGHWNFDSILQRSADLPAQLPTGARRDPAGQRFPYLEVTNGRVNFKRGVEKLPLSFTDAKFALWLGSESEWRLRFRALPVRTDLDAGYTGEMRVEGSVTRRAISTALVPGRQIALTGSWRHVPLGQFTRMMQGHDGGWRGDASVDFTLRGTAANAATTARIQLDGLRREDFVPATSVVLDAHCTAQVDLLQRSAETAQCKQSIGDGSLAIAGENISLSGAAFTASLTSAQASSVSAAWMLDAARLLRRGIAPDLAARGVINGRFDYTTTAAPGSRLTGQATWQAGELLAGGLDRPLLLPAVQWTAGSANEVQAPCVSKNVTSTTNKKIVRVMPTEAKRSGGICVSSRPATRLRTRAANESAATTLTLQPIQINLGAAQPLAISGTASRAGYDLQLQGEASLATSAPLLRAIGAARWNVLHSVSGDATVSMRIHNAWLPAADTPPGAMGTIALRNVITQTAWLPGTLRLARADATLAPDSITWKDLQWTWAGQKFDGSASRLQACTGADDCAWHVTAHTALLDIAQLRAAFAVSGTDRLRGFFHADTPGGWPPFAIDLAADTVTDGVATAQHVTAGLHAAGSNVAIQRCSGTTIGAAMECSGTIAFNDGTATLAIGLSHASIAQAAALLHEHWGHGTADASITLRLGNGNTSGDYTATLRDAALDGAVPASPLSRIDSWQLAGNIGNQQLTIDHSALVTAGRQFAATGKIGFDRSLDLTLTPTIASPNPPAAPTRVAGTLQQPVLR